MKNKKKKVITYVKKKTAESFKEDKESSLHTKNEKPLRVKYYKNRRKRLRKEIKNFKNE